MSQEDQYLKHLEGLRKLSGENYSQAKSYANLIIIAGYASYFTALNFCKLHLPLKLLLWSILFMSLSIILFVAHEVYGMISTTINLRKFQNALSDKEKYIQRLEELNKATDSEKNRIGRIWSYHLYPTLIFSIISLAFFLIPLACKLLCEICKNKP